MQVCPPGPLTAVSLHRTLIRWRLEGSQGGGVWVTMRACAPDAMLLVPSPSPPIPVKHACGRSDTLADWQSVDCSQYQLLHAFALGSLCAKGLASCCLHLK